MKYGLLASAGNEAMVRAWLEAGRHRLTEELQGRRWLNDPDARTGEFELEDLACLPGPPDLFVLAFLRFPASGKRYFVPLRMDITDSVAEALGEASYDPEFLAVLLRCMRDQRTLVTEQRRSIECRASKALESVTSAADPQTPWARPFQEGLLFRIGAAYEAGAGRRSERPPLN